MKTIEPVDAVILVTAGSVLIVLAVALLAVAYMVIA